MMSRMSSYAAMISARKMSGMPIRIAASACSSAAITCRSATITCSGGLMMLTSVSRPGIGARNSGRHCGPVSPGAGAPSAASAAATDSTALARSAQHWRSDASSSAISAGRTIRWLAESSLQVGELFEVLGVLRHAHRRGLDQERAHLGEASLEAGRIERFPGRVLAHGPKGKRLRSPNSDQSMSGVIAAHASSSGP